MSRKKTTEEFKNEVYDLVKDEYTILGEYINNATKILIKHNKCNNEYEITPHGFLRGSRCKECSGNKLLTSDEFKEKFDNLIKNNYTILNEYIDAKTKMLIRHDRCGNIYETTPKSFVIGDRCPKCQTSKRKTTEQFKKEIYNILKDEYSVLEEYNGSNNKILIKHNICGNKYRVTPSNILKNRRCPECSKNRDTHDEFVNKVYNVVKDEYSVIGNYTNSRTKVTIKHNVCNNEYQVNPNNFVNTGNRCPYCSNSRRKTQEEFTKEVYNLVGDEYEVVGDYINTHHKILLKHNICNKGYTVIPRDFLSGYRCVHCSNSKGYSIAEKELLDYITSILPNTEILSNVRNIISPKELDIYIPSLKIGIEYNGLYWHSSEYIDKNYHLDKTNECNKKGIKLIHIFEDEWLNNQELMKNKIANILNINNNTSAKDCYVKEIKDNSDLTYGLYAKDNKLLSTLALCKAKKDGVYELLNYESNHNEVDDLDMILKYIKSNNQEVNRIYAYADLRFVDKNDNIYLKNGFKFVSQLKPNYWYVIKNKRYEKDNYQKGNLKKLFPDVYDDDLSEKEIMEIMGYYRIYDCGNLKYEINMK